MEKELLEKIATQLELLNSKLDYIYFKKPKIKRSTLKDEKFEEISDLLDNCFVVSDRHFLTTKTVYEYLSAEFGEVCSLIYLGRVLSEKYKSNIKQREGAKGYSLKVK